MRRVALLLPLVAVLWLTCLHRHHVVHASPIEDCCCDATTIDWENEQQLHDMLQRIRTRTFFKIFKVNLYNSCPFWQDSGVCARRACSVCDCQDDEIPTPWKVELTSPVDKRISPDFQKWDDKAEDELWIAQDQSDSTVSFVNLLLNPEGYTGFEGDEAHRIWSAIYQENCFTGGLDSMCLEERVFYRIISGLHSCISAHTANNYPLAQSSSSSSSLGDLTGSAAGFAADDEDVASGPRPDIFEQKLGPYPDRINNLYFTFVLLLRAVNKAADALKLFDYNTGNPYEDKLTKQDVLTLLHSTVVRDCSPDKSFDEGAMFATPDKAPLLQQARNKFRNISKIIDCVGCVKCRLHGKLQVLGLGTALRILLSDATDAASISLQRNEVIALIVTLSKFSHAIDVVNTMRGAVVRQKMILYGTIAAVVAVLALLVVGVVRKWKKKRRKQALQQTHVKQT